MEKHAFLEKLKSLAASEDVLAVAHEINELKTNFQDFMLEVERKFQQAMLEAQEQEAEFDDSESLENKSLKDEFFQLYNEYRDRKTALQSAQKLEQEANLRIKKNLIDRLKRLIQEEENIGAAVAEYKEIHESWKNVGDIPREKRQEVQSEYSKLLESFFFNLKIYRELKDHDLKRNSQLKNEVVQKIEALLTLESIKDMEASIKALQNEFDETGPVPHDEWEGIKERYWEVVKQVYAKIHAFYEGKREELRQNIEKKTALLEEATAFIAGVGELATAKEWDEKTTILLGYQDQWKSIGFGTKKENEELWAAFRGQCDLFFAAKKAFYDKLKDQYQVVVERKRALIEKVNALKDSTDWKKTTEEILNLQKQWKTAGNANQRVEQGLWKEFRSACDSFFNSKQRHFEEADKQNEVNLATKMDIIAKIQSYEAPADKRQALNDLRDFSAAFNAVGKVPFKEKDAVYNAYKTAIDGHYTKLKLEGEEKDKAFFQAKMDSLKANPNADKLIDRERRDMQQQIATLRQEINTLENNLGFFAKSKGADALRKEVESKINAAKRKIEDYQRKMKLLVHE